MKAVLKKEEGLKRQFEVTISASEIDKRRDSELQQLGAKAKIDGFRPGKVPLPLLKQKYGTSVLADVIDSLIKDTVGKALAENKLRPALEPVLEGTEKYEEGKDFTYNFSIEIFPEVPDFDLAKIKVTKEVVEVGDDEINEGLKRLADGSKEFAKISVSRKSQKGDLLVFDFEGRKDGVPFAGGKAENFKLELGSGKFIPGFEDQLEGLDEGAEKTFPITFPANYHSPDLAGAATEFTIKVKEIQEVTDVKLDDEFAKRFGLKDFAELKEKVAEQIKKDFTEIAYSKVKKELFDVIDNEHKFAVPEGMIKLDYEPVAQQLKQEGSTPADKVEEEARRLAERRVRLGIILSDLAKKHDIKPTNDEIRQAIWQKATSFPGQEQKVIEFYQQNAQALDQIRGEILEDKVVQFVLGKAEVTEKKVTSKDLLAEDTADSQEKPKKPKGKK